jgi:hypothetical protein
LAVVAAVVAHILLQPPLVVERRMATVALVAKEVLLLIK